MIQYHVKTPVVLFIFNRPDLTKLVFLEIRKRQPKKLFLVSDGARSDKPGESEKVERAREIIKLVDWDCEIITNFSEINLGCKKRVSSGIDWVFGQVEEAIILEDDCMPNQTFFQFCDELLEKYRNNEKIGMISGDNFQMGVQRGEGSYYFSRYAHIWGWATWRRAWKKYDVTIASWPKVKYDTQFWKSKSLRKVELEYWQSAFQQVYDNNFDTWDHQWTYACWVNDMLTIMPNKNLISNIGFGPQATHTHGSSQYANMKTYEMGFPLVHPKLIIADKTADDITSKGMFNLPLWKKELKKIIPKKVIRWLRS